MQAMLQHRTTVTDLEIPAKQHAALTPSSVLLQTEASTASFLARDSNAVQMGKETHVILDTTVPITLMEHGVALMV